MIKKYLVKCFFGGGLLLLLLTVFTPLEFRHPPLALLVAASVFVSSFPITKRLATLIRTKWLNKIVSNLPNIVLLLGIVLIVATFPVSIITAWHSLSGYKTVWVTYRKKSNSSIKIASQMKDVGGWGYKRRTVIIVPLPPLFVWVIDADESVDTKEWEKVDEHYNPFGWKEP